MVAMNQPDSSPTPWLGWLTRTTGRTLHIGGVATVVGLCACGPGQMDTAETGMDVTSPTSEVTLPAPPGLDLTSDLRTIRQTHGVPSIAAAIASSQEVLAAGASGKRREGDSTKVTWVDDYHLGSVTKAFTAMLVARLADAGDVQWDHPITETFPGADPGWTDVTLEMLLRHESGATGSIPATHPDLWTQLWEAGDTNVVATRASFAEQLLADPPTETPGNAVYSNAGFILAGAVLEAETGQAWETLVVNEVLDPLGMDDCGFGPPMEPSAEEQPWGHTVDGTGALAPVDPTSETADNPPGIGPAGTLHCPMVDWLKFGQAHLKAASGDSSFLSTDATGRLQTSTGSDYTAGMVYAEGQPWANGPALVMNGSNTMWFATIWIAPEIDRVFVTATNAGTTGAMMATNDAVLLAIDLDL